MKFGRFIFAVVVFAGIARATVRDDIGFTDLAARPGALLAGGAGVPLAQVEVPMTGTANYAPDTSLADFSGINFTLRSGASGISAHAGQVGFYFYGDTGGIASNATSVNLFSAGSFLDGLLRMGKSGKAPGASGAMVINNSWVAGYQDDALNIQAIRRLDDLINRDDVLVFNGVENTDDGTFPKLLATSYNGVTVGLATGSRGPITLDGGPRFKPDLIAVAPTVSDATAATAGAAALLRSEAIARGMPAGQLAIKSILMSGADRDGTWRRGGPSGKDNARSPLDFQQGAGRVRVDRSFDILTAGQQRPNLQINEEAGWDFNLPAKGTLIQTYFMTLDQAMETWSAFLTWNRSIAGLRNGTYSTKQTMADFVLSLYAKPVGKKRYLLARSDSEFDNVESLTMSDLPAGSYQLVVQADIRSKYGLSWFGEESAGAAPLIRETASGGAGGFGEIEFAQVPEPPLLMLVLPMASLFCYRRPKRKGSEVKVESVLEKQAFPVIPRSLKRAH